MLRAGQFLVIQLNLDKREEKYLTLGNYDHPTSVHTSTGIDEFIFHLSFFWRNGRGRGKKEEVVFCLYPPAVPIVIGH
jgi:hypothetical protein